MPDLIKSLHKYIWACKTYDISILVLFLHSSHCILAMEATFLQLTILSKEYQVIHAAIKVQQGEPRNPIIALRNMNNLLICYCKGTIACNYRCDQMSLEY